MPIATEPFGSIPRPLRLIQATRDLEAGGISASEYDVILDESIRDTIERFEATGSPVITDGEQGKPSFATYPIHGLRTLAPDGVTIPFADGHTRQLLRLTAGPFHYANLNAGRFYIQLASEPNRQRVLGIIREHAKADELIFVGVTDPIDPNIESPEQVRDRVIEAAEYIPVDRLGTTDDCGFAPFGDDISTARDSAFQKIRARVVGTDIAARQLGVA